MKRSDNVSREFLAEAQETLETIAQALTELERYAQRGEFKAELINRVFRGFHSLKGLASMVGQQRIGRYTHALEDILDRVRKGRTPLTPKLVETLLESLDVLHMLIREVTEQTTLVSLDQALAEIHRFLTETPAPLPEATDLLDRVALPADVRRSLTEYEESRIRACVQQGQRLSIFHFVLNLTDFDEVLRKVNEVVNAYGEVISTLPGYDPSLPPDKLGFRLLVATHGDIASLQNQLPVSSRVEVVYTPEAPAEEVSGPSEAEALYDIARFVRVDLQTLDTLMNLVGELIILQTQQWMLIQALQRLHPDLVRSLHPLERISEELTRKLAETRQQVLEMRLVPVSTLHSRLDRLVRRLARQFQKEVKLELYGGDTRLDKVMMERIVDPIVHIVRNAIDHGIEPSDERQAMGKSPVGTIRIEAAPMGNRIVLRITDDGRGIDLARIRQRGVELGLLEDRPDLTEAEILHVLFQPGFSMAHRVSEVSGRGIGLDIVKQTIRELNGTITVYTQPSQGTTFEIVLPVTLAIVPAVIVRVGDERFAVPLSSVQEIIALREDLIEHIENRELLRYHQGSIPLIRLSDLFQIPSKTDGWGNALVSQVGERRFSIHVDTVERLQDIVVKRFSPRLRHLPGISGAAEVGEEQPVLVVDPVRLMEYATGFRG